MFLHFITSLFYLESRDIQPYIDVLVASHLILAIGVTSYNWKIFTTQRLNPNPRLFYFEADDINNVSNDCSCWRLVNYDTGYTTEIPWCITIMNKTTKQAAFDVQSLVFQFGTHCHLARVLTKHGDEHLSLLMLYILFSNATICAKVAASLLTRM